MPLLRVLVDGKGVGDVGPVVLRDRQLLAEEGMVVVAVTVDRASGVIVAGPEIVSRGWIYERESEAVLEEARTALRDALAEQRDAPFERDALIALLRGRCAASSRSATTGSRSSCPSSSRRRRADNHRIPSSS